MHTKTRRSWVLALLGFVAAASAGSAQHGPACHAPIPHPCPTHDCNVCKVCVPKPDVKKHIIYASCHKWFCLRRCTACWSLFGHCPDEHVQCDRPRVKNVLMKLAVDQPTLKCVIEERPCDSHPGCPPGPCRAMNLPQTQVVHPASFLGNPIPQGSGQKSERR